MTPVERDDLIVEMHTDIKWIKDWIANQNKYKLLVWGAIITAFISIIK